jgi:hypothetical protein
VGARVCLILVLYATRLYVPSKLLATVLNVKPHEQRCSSAANYTPMLVKLVCSHLAVPNVEDQQAALITSTGYFKLS